MVYFDLPLDQLKAYLPPRQEPADFDAFWQQTLSEARQFALDAHFEPVESGLVLVETFDVTFNGYGGQPIKGWFILPKQRSGPLPCVVEYIGYGGGRSFVYDWLHWANAGYAHLVMDTRGQGSSWTKGDTADPDLAGANPAYPGFMTQGILDPKTYYYRRVFTDAVRAIEAARSNPAVDKTQVIATGGSQGGGITLAAGGLEPDLAAIMPDVPFLCGYRRATEIVDTMPYGEIAKYCSVHRDKIETVFNTLSYFDGINFAARTKCAGLFSAGLMDDICPPSTVFAAYNYFAGPKRINIWPYNRHEGGANFQFGEKLKFLKEVVHAPVPSR